MQAKFILFKSFQSKYVKPMKRPILLIPITALIMLAVAGCVAYPEMPHMTMSNQSDAENLHDTYSPAAADAFLERGKTTVIDISLKYGQPLTAMKDEEGNNIWIYQVRTSNIDVNMQGGTGVNVGLLNSRSSTAMQSNTAITTRVTTLKLVIDQDGYLKDYESTISLQ